VVVVAVVGAAFIWQVSSNALWVVVLGLLRADDIIGCHPAAARQRPIQDIGDPGQQQDRHDKENTPRVPHHSVDPRSESEMHSQPPDVPRDSGLGLGRRCRRRGFILTQGGACNATRQDHYEPGIYVIRIRGHLDEKWADLFDGLIITLEDNGDTLLTGPVVDQAALHGLLKKVRDLGMPLVSVSPLEPGQAVLDRVVRLEPALQEPDDAGSAEDLFGDHRTRRGWDEQIAAFEPLGDPFEKFFGRHDSGAGFFSPEDVEQRRVLGARPDEVGGELQNCG
jgi:hypothetical protein